MHERRWLRIIPVALIMYTISYVDRTNISLALDPKISTMMKDLFMDDRRKGAVAGIFFFGYVLLQIPGGYWARRWSARKIVSVFLVSWGACAVGCGLAQTFQQFVIARFLLGVAESGVLPATLVLLSHWFPRAERARANAYWILCQPLALVASAPVTGKLLDVYGWQKMMIIEGMLPFVWLPIWWFLIRDHPREAKWISAEERNYLETTLQAEAAALEPPATVSIWSRLCHPAIARMILVLIALHFLQNCAAYGCMTFFTSTLQGRGYSGTQYAVLFAIPYAIAAIFMIINSRHSDKTHERRGHVAVVYFLTGSTLILSVSLKDQFWLSYGLMCLAIQGPFSGQAPFWAVPSENLPRNLLGPVVGLVNAVGNVGGFVGPYMVGWLKSESNSIVIPFATLGAGMILASGLAFLLPKTTPPGAAALGSKT
jgi:MFS family permease